MLNDILWQTITRWVLNPTRPTPHLSTTHPLPLTVGPTRPDTSTPFSLVPGFRASLSPLPPLGALDRHPLAYSPLSHHAYQPYPLGRLPQSHSLKSDSGLLTGGALWDMENVAPPLQAGYAGASAYHADGSHAGTRYYRYE